MPALAAGGKGKAIEFQLLYGSPSVLQPVFGQPKAG